MHRISFSPMKRNSLTSTVLPRILTGTWKDISTTDGSRNTKLLYDPLFRCCVTALMSSSRCGIGMILRSGVLTVIHLNRKGKENTSKQTWRVWI